MSLLWPKGAYQGQKIFIITAMYLSLSSAICLLAYRDFAPNRIFFWPSLALSLIVALSMTSLVIHGVKKGIWKSSKEFANYSRSKKAIAFVSIPIFVLLTTWLNFYYLLPRAITKFAGEPTSKVEVVTAQRNFGKHKYCEFSVKSHSIESPMLKICTNPIFHANSPEGNFHVKIHLQESFLGFIVTGVSRVQ